MEFLLALIALGVAGANGANDNFKGLATVWGSNVLDYRRALYVATAATLAGSLAAVWLANGLIAQFSGRGLVSAQLASSTNFLLAVGSGVVITVSLATRLGFPISTTHALIGSMVGAGLADHAPLEWTALGKGFVLPLLLSPLLSAFFTWLLSALIKERTSDVCICIDTNAMPKTSAHQDILSTASLLPHVVLAEESDCQQIPAARKTLLSHWLDRLHLASAASICFARAVNDTPKIAALLVAAQLTHTTNAVIWIGIAMSLGGFFGARRVAQTMSYRISRMSAHQGLLANLVTACLVLLASKFSLPVSTTHVSVGSIAGMGLRSGQLDRPAIRSILLSWVITLPFSALSAYLVAICV